MVEAYILINVEIGKVEEAKEKLSKIKGVKKVDMVAGPIDIIAYVEAATLRELRNFILWEIHRTPGITKTQTALVL